MLFKDHYRTLGVAPDADAEAIKNAYRSLARKFHPDINKTAGAEKRFTAIGEAHDVLKDAGRRAAFDQLRAAGAQEGQEMDAPPPWQQPFRRRTSAPDDPAQFADIFQELFGNHQRRAFPEPGEDSHYAFAVTLEEAYRGGARELSLTTPGTADARSISVTIPAGVVQGTRIRLRGQGRSGTGAAAPGDLYLEVELAPHRLFQVEGHDLLLDLPILPWEAALGAQVEVPTLGGSVTTSIPAGAQNGQKLRLKGRGLPGEHPGDQYLTLRIVVPPNPDDTAKSLYRELAKTCAYDPRAALVA